MEIHRFKYKIRFYEELKQKFEENWVYKFVTVTNF